MAQSESLEVVYENESATEQTDTGRSPESERAESVAWNVSEPPAPKSEPKPAGKRQKRTEAQVLADLRGDTLSEAKYLQDRVIKLEEKIAELFSGVSAEAVELVLKSRGYDHLRRYLP